MTESDWITATDPREMLMFLRDSGKPSERKLRLFAAACCRRVWHLLADGRSRMAVAVAERFADGRATEVECFDAHRACGEVRFKGVVNSYAGNAAGSASRLTPRIAEDAADFVADAFAWATQGSVAANRAVGDATHAVLLRDVFGNPFSTPPPENPAWLAWEGGTIARLAEAAYHERTLPSGELDRERLAVLADALEEVGADALLLEHLRGPGPHVRGCWVLDLLTRRE